MPGYGQSDEPVSLSEAATDSATEAAAPTETCPKLLIWIVGPAVPPRISCTPCPRWTSATVAGPDCCCPNLVPVSSSMPLLTPEAASKSGSPVLITAAAPILPQQVTL